MVLYSTTTALLNNLPHLLGPSVFVPDAPPETVHAPFLGVLLIRQWIAVVLDPSLGHSLPNHSNNWCTNSSFINCGLIGLKVDNGGKVSGALKRVAKHSPFSGWAGSTSLGRSQMDTFLCSIMRKCNRCLCIFLMPLLNGGTCAIHFVSQHN